MDKWRKVNDWKSGSAPNTSSTFDEWRRYYAEDLPPRAEAIVRLMEIGLKADARTLGKLVRPAKDPEAQAGDEEMREERAGLIECVEKAIEAF